MYVSNIERSNGYGKTPGSGRGGACPTSPSDGLRPAVAVHFCLLETEPEFTLNVLPEEFRGALELCVSKSGRDLDKWKATGLERAASEAVAVPRVAQAVLSLECRVVASMNVSPTKFLEPAMEEFYPEKDYHRVYLGEVVAAYADERFLKP